MSVPVVRLVLVGMMGSGKTTVGRALATATGWPYLDNDERLRARTGLGTDELFVRKGESALRDAESSVLREILRHDPPYIAGVAAGVVTRSTDRLLLAESDAVIVWLCASIATLVRNVGAGEGRPWLQPDPEAALRQLAAGRAALYREVADIVVEVEHLSPEAAADQVLTRLRASLS